MEKRERIVGSPCGGMAIEKEGGKSLEDIGSRTRIVRRRIPVPSGYQDNPGLHSQLVNLIN